MYSNLGTRRIGGAFETLAMVAAALSLATFFTFVTSDPASVFLGAVSPLIVGALSLAAAITDMNGKALPSLILIAVSGGLAVVFTLLQLTDPNGLFIISDLLVVSEAPIWLLFWVQDLAPLVVIGLAIYAFVALRGATRVAPLPAGRATALKVTGLVGIVLMGSGLLAVIGTLFWFGTWWIGLIPLIVGVELLYVWLASAIANLAESKGRSWALFFWLALLVSWFIMLIIAAAVSPLETQQKSRTVAETSLQNSEDPGEQIRKLQKLKDEGLLTEAEFNLKKKEMLDRF